MSDCGVTLQDESVAIQARHLLVITQAIFFGVLLLCFFINHGSTAQADGISFYGVYAPTIELLIVGFTAGAFGLWRTAWYFSRTDAPKFSVIGLRIIALELFLLLLTPYNKGTFFNWAHMVVGVSMSLVQLGIVYLLLKRRRSALCVTGLVIQLLGGVIGAFSLPDWNFMFLLQGETLFEVGFSLCLIEWTYAVFARQNESALAAGEN
jgi:hypothetical protein